MIYWILVIVPVTIMGQAAYLKWTEEPAVIANFKKLGMEPEGRGLITIIELICVVLLLFPRLSIYGAILCLGIMVGAIIAHATVIGFAEDRWQWFLRGVLLRCDLHAAGSGSVDPFHVRNNLAYPNHQHKLFSSPTVNSSSGFYAGYLPDSPQEWFSPLVIRPFVLYITVIHGLRNPVRQ